MRRFYTFVAQEGLYTLLKHKVTLNIKNDGFVFKAHNKIKYYDGLYF